MDCLLHYWVVDDHDPAGKRPVAVEGGPKGGLPAGNGTADGDFRVRENQPDDSKSCTIHDGWNRACMILPLIISTVAFTK